MSEKRLSVRLAAVGGDKLRAELMEIGRDGERAFRRVGQATEPANQGFSRARIEAGQTAQDLDRLAARASRMARQMRAAGATTESVMARINRATGVSAGPARSAADIEAYGRALDDMRAKANPAFRVIRQYRQEVQNLRKAHRVGAISAQEMTAAIRRERSAALDSLAAIKGRTRSIRQMARASRMGSFRLQQMAFQVNDIGVSLASGMNPFMVMAQQGTQIAQIYGFGNGGVGAALRDIGGMVRGLVTKTGPVLAVVAALGVAVKGLQLEINKTSSTAVTFGDTLLAIWQTARDALMEKLRPAINAIAPWLAEAWQVGVQAVKDALNLIVNGWRATVLIIRRVWSAGIEAIVIRAEAMPVALQANWTAIQAGFYRMVAALQTRWGEFIGDIAGGMANIPGMADTAADLSEYAFDQMARASAREGTAIRLEGQADALRAQVEQMRSAAGNLVTEAVTDALADAATIMGEDPMGELFQQIRVRAIQNALDRAAEAASGAGSAASQAAEAAARGWAKAAESIQDYARDAMDLAGNLGQGFVNAFQSAESALDKFVREGSFNIREFVAGVIADFAKIGARRYIFGPLANALGGWLGNLGGGGNLFASVAHEGGEIGRDALPRRAVPAAIFADAPRLHNGGWAGLRPNEVPAILERGERVLSREEARGIGDVHVHINGVRDFESFRQSRAQIAADLGRAVAGARRGM